MTAVELRPVLLPGAAPSDAKRREALTWLARSAPDMPACDIICLLEEWAHRSLSRRQREAAFAEYTDVLARADDLASGLLTWQTEYPELRAEEGQDRAVELAKDRADEALFPLIHGVGE